MSWLDIRQNAKFDHEFVIIRLLHTYYTMLRPRGISCTCSPLSQRRGANGRNRISTSNAAGSLVIGTDNQALRKSDLILPQRGWDKYHRSDLTIRRHFPTGCRLRSAPQWRRKSLGGGGECFRLGSAAPSQFSPSSMWNISL